MNLFRALVPLFTLAVTIHASISWAQTYDCRRITSPVVVDGALDDSVWQTANWVSLRKNESGDTPDSQGKFSILWDSRNLYLAYDFVDHNILTTIDTRDARLWIQDVAEIFIAPLQSEKIYYEFQFNARDNWRDVVVIHRGVDHQINPLAEWDSSIKLGAVVRGTLENNQDQDQGWTLEVAIPFEDLWLVPNIPPKSGDQWRVNVFRIDYGLESTELSAWNPTNGPSFHVPTKFGTLIFR
ncbi:MAG TPA: carbohydrate-binding family 9-like protein [Acidobacteriota bacterium]|nr:carbohydrate-binding family 9-like protein [Acidobacteriota bacterium]